MEAVLGGPLHQHIHHMSGIGVNNCKIYSAQIISALIHMGERGCVHRDIKASNCVLNDKGHIKICDFGSAAVLFPSESEFSLAAGAIRCPRTFTVIGTEHAMAPEMVCEYSRFEVDEKKRCGYGLSVDWWSLGVLIQEMLFCYVPSDSDISSLRGLPLECVSPVEVEGNGSEFLHPLLVSGHHSCESCGRVHSFNFYDLCLSGHQGAIDCDSETAAHAVCVMQQLLAYNIEERLGPWNESRVSS